MGGQRWTPEEDRVILENYPRLSAAEIRKLLPGRRNACGTGNRVKALRRMGIPIPPRWQYQLRNLPQLSYTEVEKAWLACAVDCEGSVSIDHNHGKAYSPYIFFGNSKQDIVEYFHKVSRAPVSVFVMRYQDSRHGKWSDQWHVKVRLRPWVYAFLKQVQPFLIVKRDQAQLVLEFIELRDSRNERRENYSERQIEIYREIKALNRRGAK